MRFGPQTSRHPPFQTDLGARVRGLEVKTSRHPIFQTELGAKVRGLGPKPRDVPPVRRIWGPRYEVWEQNFETCPLSHGFGGQGTRFEVWSKTLETSPLSDGFWGQGLQKWMCLEARGAWCSKVLLELQQPKCSTFNYELKRIDHSGSTFFF